MQNPIFADADSTHGLEVWFDSSMVATVVYGLRYEVVFVASLLVCWCIGRLASNHVPKDKVRGKPSTSLKSGVHQLPLAGKSLQSQGHDRHLPRARHSSKPNHHGQTAKSSIRQANSQERGINMEMPDAESLRKPELLVPRLVQLCQGNAQRAVELYRSASKAGLDLRTISAADRECLFTALVTSMLRMGFTEEATKLLSELRDLGLGVSSSILASALKICTAKHLYQDSLVIYDLVAGAVEPPLADKTVWSCLVFCAFETQEYTRCDSFFQSLKANGVPSQKDYWNIIRISSLRGDWKSMLKLIEEMSVNHIEIDNVIYNTALAAFVSANEIDEARQLLGCMNNDSPGCSDVITYNTLMKGYAKSGHMDECFNLYVLMKERGLEPSQVSYGILLDGYINDCQVDKAAEVFDILTKEGCPMNTVLYTTLIKGFAREGKVDDAMRVFRCMISGQAVAPDVVTFSILLKANCDIGNLDVAFGLLEDMLEFKLRPDEVIFNNLLAGCAKQSNVELAKRLYGDMIASGVRPSNATFSILIRLYSQCKLLDEAVELLKVEAAVHKVTLEPRLFSQLIQGCVRSRQGRRAVDVYKLMLESPRCASSPTAALHSAVLGICTKLNMFDTAAEILAVAAANGLRVDRSDATQVFEGASKKHKTACASSCAASMRLFGFGGC